MFRSFNKPTIIWSAHALTSAAPQVDPFTGNDWEECNSFIRALRSRALWEGKQRDSAWIADFAAQYFSHKALLWHCRLPQDVREDWSKLQIALLEQWTPPENENDSNRVQIEPTPAAAPSMIRIKEGAHPLQGILKFVLDGSNKEYYVHLDRYGETYELTSSPINALRVRYSSLSNATLLERMDGPTHSWLAVHWSQSVPNLIEGSTDFAFLTLVDSESLKSSWARTVNAPWQLMTCSVSTNGEVTPVWNKDSISKITLIPFCNGSSAIWLAADANAYSKDPKNMSEKRGKLIIEHKPF